MFSPAVEDILHLRQHTVSPACPPMEGLPANGGNDKCFIINFY